MKDFPKLQLFGSKAVFKQSIKNSCTVWTNLIFNSLICILQTQLNCIWSIIIIYLLHWRKTKFLVHFRCFTVERVQFKAQIEMDILIRALNWTHLVVVGGYKKMKQCAHCWLPPATTSVTATSGCCRDSLMTKEESARDV